MDDTCRDTLWLELESELCVVAEVVGYNGEIWVLMVMSPEDATACSSTQMESPGSCGFECLPVVPVLGDE